MEPVSHRETPVPIISIGAVDGVLQRLCGKVRAHRPDGGHRPDTDLRSAASADDPGRYEAHYNGRRPIAAASSARPGPTTQSPTFPRSESAADPSSAASSTNMSGLRRSRVNTGGRVLEPHRVAFGASEQRAPERHPSGPASAFPHNCVVGGLSGDTGHTLFDGSTTASISSRSNTTRYSDGKAMTRNNAGRTLSKRYT